MEHADPWDGGDYDDGGARTFAQDGGGDGGCRQSRGVLRPPPQTFDGGGHLTLPPRAS